MKNKSHKDYQEKINGLWSNFKLFDRGLKQFEGQLCLIVFATYINLAPTLRFSTVTSWGSPGNSFFVIL